MGGGGVPGVQVQAGSVLHPGQKMLHSLGPIINIKHDVHDWWVLYWIDGICFLSSSQCAASAVHSFTFSWSQMWLQNRSGPKGESPIAQEIGSEKGSLARKVNRRSPAWRGRMMRPSLLVSLAVSCLLNSHWQRTGPVRTTNIASA